MSSPSLQLSVIVPSHQVAGTHGRVYRLLESLGEGLQEIEHEVLVVANPPDPTLAEILRRHPRYRYVDSTPSGANRARNRGIDAAKGDVLLFLDDDCVVTDPSFFKAHLEWHRENPNADGIGGPYFLPPGAGLFSRAYHFRQLEWIRRGLRADRKAIHLLGGNLSFKAQSLKETRFDEAMVFGGTETELLNRMVMKGGRFLYADTLAVSHETSLSVSEFIRKAFLQGMGKAWIESKTEAPVAASAWPSAASEKPSQLLRVVLWMYDLAFAAGFAHGQHAGLVQLSSRRIQWLVFMQLLKEIPLTRQQMNPLVTCMRAAREIATRARRSK